MEAKPRLGARMSLSRDERHRPTPNPQLRDPPSSAQKLARSLPQELYVRIPVHSQQCTQTG